MERDGLRLRMASVSILWHGTRTPEKVSGKRNTLPLKGLQQMSLQQKADQEVARGGLLKSPNTHGWESASAEAGICPEAIYKNRS